MKKNEFYFWLVGKILGIGIGVIGSLIVFLVN